MILVIVLLILLCSVLGFLLYKATKRLIEFDDLFQLFIHDIDTNVRHYNKLQKLNIMNNSPEVMEAHRNMQIMSARLGEYRTRMTEIRNKDAEKSS